MSLASPILLTEDEKAHFCNSESSQKVLAGFVLGWAFSKAPGDTDEVSDSCSLRACWAPSQQGPFLNPQAPPPLSHQGICCLWTPGASRSGPLPGSNMHIACVSWGTLPQLGPGSCHFWDADIPRWSEDWKDAMSVS